MKNPSTPSIVGCLASGVAGLALGYMLKSGGAPFPDRSSTAPAVPQHRNAVSPALQEAARERLRQLGHDPFLPLTAEEVSTLASQLDLTQPADVRLLNQILNPELQSRLWEACLREGAKNLSLKELRRICEEVQSMSYFPTVYDGVFERIVKEGAQNDFFDGGLRSRLFNKYGDYCARAIDNLKQATAALPENSGSFREILISSWISNHPDIGHLHQLLDLSPAEGGSRTTRYGPVGQIWETTPPSGRQAFLEELRKVDPGQRNDLLSAIPWKVPKDDPALLVQVMDEMGSFDAQRSAVSIFTGDSNWEAAQRLIDYIDTLPNADRYAKIRAYANLKFRNSKPKE